MGWRKELMRTWAQFQPWGSWPSYLARGRAGCWSVISCCYPRPALLSASVSSSVKGINCFGSHNLSQPHWHMLCSC